MMGDDRVAAWLEPRSTQPLLHSTVGGSRSLPGTEPSSQPAHTRPSVVPMTTKGSAVSAGEVAICTAALPATGNPSRCCAPVPPGYWHTPPGHWVGRQSAFEPVQVLVAASQVPPSGHVGGRQGFIDVAQRRVVLSHAPPSGSQLLTKHVVANAFEHRPRMRHRPVG